MCSKLDFLFKEVAERDFNWVCRFELLLFTTVYDLSNQHQNGQTEENRIKAFDILDHLWEQIKQKPGKCLFERFIFRLRIHLSKNNPELFEMIEMEKNSPEQSGWHEGWVETFML